MEDIGLSDREGGLFAAESAPIGGGCRAQGAVETPAEVGGRGKADPDRDRLDGQVGLLQQDLGGREFINLHCKGVRLTSRSFT
jgi:hypothetical protein